MLKAYQDSHVTQYCGNAMEVLQSLESETVQCCVTSPPYWGLRLYSGEQEMAWGDSDCEHEWGQKLVVKTHHAGETNPGKEYYTKDSGQWSDNRGSTCLKCGAWRGAYGLEPTPEMYVEHTIEFLRAIRRVLRSDGVVFWDIGDSYMSSPSNQYGDGVGQRYKTIGQREKRVPSGSIKTKDLCLIPFRVALAAQSDGWWVRSIIIWSKPNPMPESVKDRPTESHEYILMLTKAKSYYWDIDAVREPATRDWADVGGSILNRTGWMEQAVGDDGHKRKIGVDTTGRNIRSVWTMNTQPFSECHFAVFPEELPRRCILAATSEKGNCSKCGKPWVRVVESEAYDTEGWGPSRKDAHRELHGSQSFNRVEGKNVCGKVRTTTLGWQPQCECNAPTEPPVVLDCFSGAGTTGLVAKQLGRRAILIDTSEDYCKMAQRRIEEIPIPMELSC